MQVFVCPGLPAPWVNAWLAAIGATVLDSRIRLHWTSTATPMAVLTCMELDPVAALVESWPDAAFLQDLPIAENWGEAAVLKRKVSVEQFVARAREARGHPNAWTLSSTLTDLSVDRNGEVVHAPFDAAGPGPTRWLHHRLLRVHGKVGRATNKRLRESLVGQADRVRDNGLGFDISRIGSLADKQGKWTDPVVECLAFFGLAVFPLRGRGTDRRLVRHGDADERQRGWRKMPGTREPRRFVWPAWRQPLDDAGVDALLDVWNPWHKRSWRLMGIHAAWRSVSYERRAKSDVTRGYGAEML